MRGIPFVVPGLIVAGGLFVAATPPTSADVRTDIVDDTFFPAYLKWGNGNGTLSWRPDSPTEDEVAPARPASPNMDEFVSTPTPFALYINVSKLTQLDLFLKPPFLPANVEIWIGKEFFGGGVGGSTDSIWYGNPKTCNGQCADRSQEPTAAGYSTYSHRIAAELDVIPKGSIITLRIIRLTEQPYVYGFAGEHGSVLRFPTFNAEEVLYRIPKYQNQPTTAPGSPLVPAGTVDDLVSGILNGGALGLAPFAALVARRRHARVNLLLALLASTALAACTAGPPGGEQRFEDGGLGGSASSYIIPDGENETGLTTTERGSLFGVVSDPEGLPINGAFAALLGRPHSTRTDAWGRFHFNSLVPATYTLHIDREGFLPLETNVEVEAASITKLAAILDYASDKDRDHRPHRHDYWFDASGKPVDAVVLLDGAEPVNQYDTGFSTWLLPPPLLVKPATVDVEINVTWEGEFPFMLEVGVPNDRHNETILYPRESGHAFHLRTTWEMTDPGHSVYTYWREIGVQPLGSPCTQYALGYNDPRCPANPVSENVWDPKANAYGFHIRVTIHKGVLPLESPHPDYWGSSATLPVIANETQAIKSYCVSACPIGLPNNGSPDGSPGVDLPLYGFVGTTKRAYNATWAVQELVPFETRWLQVALRASRPFAQSGDAAWRLYYRDAETTNYGKCDRSAHTLYSDRDPFYNQAVTQEAGLSSMDPTGLAWTWRIPVRVEGADAPYAKRSNWCFYVAPADQNAYMVDAYGQQYGQGQVAKMELTLSVDAHKDPMPKF